MIHALYHTHIGRFILKCLTWPPISQAAGRFLDSGIYRHLIQPFIQMNSLDMTDVLEEEWPSFNAFFVRHLKTGSRPVDMDPEAFIAPCDGLLSVYSLEQDGLFEVKDSLYTVEELLQNRRLAEEFKGGSCLIFRLTPSHYHRYCYPDSGRKTRNVFIPGVLHTVQPVAVEAVPVFHQNCREFTLLRTDHFGPMIFMEVGAMLVGRICNYDSEAGKITRGREKGRFEFGGSTIILLLKKEISLRTEILEASASGEEYPVKMGERLN